MIRDAKSSQDAADALKGAALKRGSKENVSVIVVDLQKTRDK